MASLQHGILTVKIISFAYELTGFYFTPMDSQGKCLLLDPSVDKSLRVVPLAEIINSGLFSEISYRELINQADSKLFKLALVNMQSSFDSSDIEIAVRDDISKIKDSTLSRSKNHSDSSSTSRLTGYASPYIDYIVKAIGQNPAERTSQCSGSCYVGPVVNIKSYDPFAPLKIYHRNIPLLTEKDNIRLQRWSKFFGKQIKEFFIRRGGNLYLDKDLTSNNIEQTPVAQEFILPSNLTPVKEFNIPPDTLFQAFLHNMIDDGTAAHDVNPIVLPLSFKVPDGYIFPGDTQNHEKISTTWGLNIYDGACWEIALWLLYDSHAGLLDQIRLTRKTTQFASIIGNNVNSKRSNQYLAPLNIDNEGNPIGENTSEFRFGPDDPNERKIIYPYDPNGYAFKIISNYFNYDPNVSKPTQWVPNIKYWNDFSSGCGENAWFYVLAPYVRNATMNNFKGYAGFVSTLFNMMDSNGGFYSSPINSNNTAWTLSSTDNASMFGALFHIYSYMLERPHINLGLSENQIIVMINGVLQYFSTMADRDNYFFYSGKTWSTSHKSWLINYHGFTSDLTPFNVNIADVNMPLNAPRAYVVSVAVQLWSICSLQPSMIDALFGEKGASLKMWTNLRRTCGRLGAEGELRGFGYNNVRVNTNFLPSHNQTLFDSNYEIPAKRVSTFEIEPSSIHRGIFDTTADALASNYEMGLLTDENKRSPPLSGIINDFTTGVSKISQQNSSNFNRNPLGSHEMSIVISTELTFAAMLACKILKAYYKDLADNSPYSVSIDLMEMETYMYGLNHDLLVVTEDNAYFNQANVRAQTGFGSYVNSIPSISATAWNIFYNKSFNPFVPDGNLLREDPTQ
ncbi:Hypothetical protein HVR_LOCUS45 [uncultured virus]|nr:Hypothetical protein HVR_LOCUS45 [uncultured virus]